MQKSIYYNSLDSELYLRHTTAYKAKHDCCLCTEVSEEIAKISDFSLADSDKAHICILNHNFLIGLIHFPLYLLLDRQINNKLCYKKQYSDYLKKIT